MSANEIQKYLEDAVFDNSENTSLAQWQEKKPLRRQLPEPNPFPIDALGDLLGGAAIKMAEIIKAPLAICGQSVLAAATLAAQGFVDIEIDGRLMPISCFFLTIGKTGERKSAVDSMALKPHRDYQMQLREKYLIEIENWSKEFDAFDAAKKEATKGKNKTYENKLAALKSLGNSPIKPIDYLIIAEEPTYEGLVKMLENGQPSVGLFSDEGGRFIGGHGMNSDNMLKTAAGLSGIWDGRPINRVRSGDGATMLVGRRVSAHLMMQPEVAQILLSNALLAEQGLLSRCLTAFPNSTAGTRQYNDKNLTKQAEFLKYEKRMQEILNTPKKFADGKLNELNPKLISVAQDAKKFWEVVHNTVEVEISDGGKFSAIRGLANKAPEHVLRLAAVLTLVNNLDSEFIDLQEIKFATQLVEYYLNEALRLFDMADTDPKLIMAEKLLQWFFDKNCTTVTLVEIYQYGINSIRTAKVARKIMGILVEHGYALPLADGAEFEGTHRSEAWELNL